MCLNPAHEFAGGARDGSAPGAVHSPESISCVGLVKAVCLTPRINLQEVLEMALRLVLSIPLGVFLVLVLLRVCA